MVLFIMLIRPYTVDSVISFPFSVFVGTLLQSSIGFGDYVVGAYVVGVFPRAFKGLQEGTG